VDETPISLHSDSIEPVHRKMPTEVFMVRLVACPEPGSNDFGEAGGAYVNCYVDADDLRTAEIRADHPTWRLFKDGCPKGESAADIGARTDRVVDRLRRCVGNVLLFGHRDMLRVLAARWLQFPALEGRRFYLDPGSLSLLGYDHNTSEPVIRLWNKSSLFTELADRETQKT